MKSSLQILFVFFLQHQTPCESCPDPPCDPTETGFKTISTLVSTPSPSTAIRAKCSPFTETECVEYISEPDNFFSSADTCRHLGGSLASVINETENSLLQQFLDSEGVSEVIWNRENQLYRENSTGLARGFQSQGRGWMDMGSLVMVVSYDGYFPQKIVLRSNTSDVSLSAN